MVFVSAGFEEGWFLGSDVLLKLPLVIFCNIIYIPYRVSDIYIPYRVSDIYIPYRVSDICIPDKVISIYTAV